MTMAKSKAIKLVTPTCFNWISYKKYEYLWSMLATHSAHLNLNELITLTSSGV